MGVRPLPEVPGLPDPLDRTQAWAGDEPAYQAWWRYAHGLTPAGERGELSRISRDVRSELLKLYSWAVPTREALDCLLEQGPLLEVGAAGGYWARLLRDLGGDVLACDVVPPEKNAWIGGTYSGARAVVAPNWTTVEVADHMLVGDHLGRTVFMSWPANRKDVQEVLRKFRPVTVALIVWPLAAIPHDEDDFYPILEAEWEMTRFVELPHWETITDNLSVWRRRG